MSIVKRLLSICLILAMVWAWIPAPEAQAADTVDATVYVDAVNGSDDFDGTAETTAKKTLNPYVSSIYCGLLYNNYC